MLWTLIVSLVRARPPNNPREWSEWSAKEAASSSSSSSKVASSLRIRGAGIRRMDDDESSASGERPQYCA
jgi:hypothetical protein